MARFVDLDLLRNRNEGSRLAQNAQGRGQLVNGQETGMASSLHQTQISDSRQRTDLIQVLGQPGNLRDNTHINTMPLWIQPTSGQPRMCS